MFTFPFLPFNPLCSNGYINTQQYNSSTTFPVVHTAYNSGLAPDSVMAGQSTFAVPPMQNFMGTAGVYQAQGMMGNGNGSSHKKNGNLSCYNCGASGHRAQDCKQPPMDFNRQGKAGGDTLRVVLSLSWGLAATWNLWLGNNALLLKVGGLSCW